MEYVFGSSTSVFTTRIGLLGVSPFPHPPEGVGALVLPTNHYFPINALNDFRFA